MVETAVRNALIFAGIYALFWTPLTYPYLDSLVELIIVELFGCQALYLICMFPGAALLFLLPAIFTGIGFGLVVLITPFRNKDST